MERQTSLTSALLDRKHRSHLRRVAVVRSLEGLGDFLCVTPALRSLRAALPLAHITFVGLPKMQPLMQRFQQLIDELLLLPGYPGLPEQAPQLQEIPAFFVAAQNRRFDLAIQMHGSGMITNPLTVLLGATCNAGFFLPDQYCPDPDSFLPYLERESEVQRYLRLIKFLGIPTQGEALEFPLVEADHVAFEQLTAAQRLQPKQYVCIHPGASVAERCWSPKRFAIVADALAQRGFQVVLTGSSAEVPLTHTVARFMQAQALDLAGCTNLGALAVLLKGARLLVCNDTGVSHLAVALQTPSVVIFTGSDPERWAPLDRTRHRVVCPPENTTAETAIAQADVLLQQSIVTEQAAVRLQSIAAD